MYEIKISDAAGFCFGVQRAVETIERVAGEGGCVVTLGPIVHNRHVVERFAQMGVREIASVDEAPPESTVIIRAHGVDRATMLALEARGVRVVDATCPFVERIHELVRRAEAGHRTPVIYGSRTHPEVVGISGWCEHPIVVESPAEFEAWLADSPENADLPIALVAQTTSNQGFWKKIVEISKKNCTNAKLFDTICRATEVRQTEAAELASRSDTIIVVGDKSSANTRQLAAICREHCPRVYLIDSAADLRGCDFSDSHSIGITAAARRTCAAATFRIRIRSASLQELQHLRG